MKYFTYRKICFYNFLIIIGLLAFAAYLQMHDKIAPCPLCVIQRFIFAIIGLLFLFGSFVSPTPKGRKRYSLFIFLFSLIGAGVAGRQVWLQHLPMDQVPTCGPGFNFMLNNLPFYQAMKLIFYGSGECAQIGWQFLQLSIAEWSFLFFVFFALLAFMQAYRRS